MSRASSNVEWMLLTRGKTSEERLVKLMPADKSQSPDERLQQEFNRWADDGEGAKMEPCAAWICVRESAFSISAADQAGRRECSRVWSAKSLTVPGR